MGAVLTLEVTWDFLWQNSQLDANEHFWGKSTEVLESGLLGIY